MKKTTLIPHHHRIIRHYSAGFMILLSLLCACSSQNTPLAGGTSQTGNAKVRGTMTSPDGLQSGTIVQLTPVDYDPILGNTTAGGYADTTDSIGSYEFIDVEPDTYNLEAVNIRTGKRAIIQSIFVTGPDSLRLSTNILTTSAVLIIRLPNHADTLDGRIAVPGTHIVRHLRPYSSNSNYMILDSLPAGILPGILYGRVSDNGTGRTRLLSAPKLIAGDTTFNYQRRTYYVSPAGSDSNNGETAPFKTIKHGLAAVDAGDSLIIESGMYTGETTMVLLRSGLPSLPITITAIGPVTVSSAQTPGSAASGYGLLLNNLSHIKVHGITFVGYEIGTKIIYSSNCTIENCSFINYSNAGIQTWNTAFSTISNCQFIKPMRGGNGGAMLSTGNGIVLYGSHHQRITGCYFFGDQNAACYFKRQNDSCTIAQCVVEGTFSTAWYLGDGETDEDRCQNLAVTHTIVRLNGALEDQALVVIDNVENALCSNNYLEIITPTFSTIPDAGSASGFFLTPRIHGTVTIHHNYIIGDDRLPGISINAPLATRILIHNNTNYRCTDDVIELQNGSYFYANNLSFLCGGAYQGPTNFRNDPKFSTTIPPPGSPVEYSLTRPYAEYFSTLTRPFLLRSDSPCIDAGEDVGYSFIGSAPDIGAQEFHR